MDGNARYNVYHHQAHNAMNYARFINRVSASRRPSPIRKLTAILAQSPPSMISLAAGSPNPNLFPFESAQVKLRDGHTLNLDSAKMKVALQYGPTPGNADVLKWLKNLQDHFHRPPTLTRDPENGGLDICITPGCQDALCKTFEALVSHGDNVVIDCPTYSGTLAILRPLGCNLLPIETDKEGMIPDSLRATMSRWTPADVKDPESDVPKLLYTIPNGVNPTGSSLTEQRKVDIYKIAKEYNMIIVEDDPYYFLQYTDNPSPSFLSMDNDGRVLRYDSFSKILSSGLRFGFVSGPQPLVKQVIMHQMVSAMQTSTMSQVLVNEVLQHWGLEGFKTHVKDVVNFYRSQKEIMISSANKRLKGLAEWHEPVAGMFLWMKLNGIDDTKELIESKALKKEVLLVPGCAFMPDPDAPCPYVRASFSLASAEQIDKGLERLAELIKEELASK